jgi:hypothetical protein
MTLVRIVATYDFPLSRYLKPGGWEGVEFTTEPVERCDYLLSFNYPPQSFETLCPAEHCWAIIQEPPSLAHRWLHTSHHSFARIYSCDGRLRGPHRVKSFPALGWHVDRSWEWLSTAPAPPKTRLLSTVTSNLGWMDGHRRRLEFLTRLKGDMEYDWWGRGIRDLPDKWEGLAPYHYSLAFENFVAEDYWTEKLSDCFLAWTVPIYGGCPNVEAYFPADAMVRLDLANPERARSAVLRALESEPGERVKEALAVARDLVLERYSPLAFVVAEIRAHQLSGCRCRVGRARIASRVYPVGRPGKLRYLAQSWWESLRR